MPTQFVEPDPMWIGHLIYEAPLDEKTKKIREQFDVDPVTGYQRKYHWRRMANLPVDYRPEEAYEKLTYYDPNQYISTKVMFTTGTLLATTGFHVWYQLYCARPWWGNLYRPFVMTAALCALANWVTLKSLDRNAMKQAIIVDYLRQHPDRFEKIHRPKLREVLFFYQPIR